MRPAFMVLSLVVTSACGGSVGHPTVDAAPATVDSGRGTVDAGKPGAGTFPCGDASCGAGEVCEDQCTICDVAITCNPPNDAGECPDGSTPGGDCDAGSCEETCGPDPLVCMPNPGADSCMPTDPSDPRYCMESCD